MEAAINLDNNVKAGIINFLADFGCCDLCILRYLGNIEPYVYRESEQALKKMLFGLGLKNDENTEPNGKTVDPASTGKEDEPSAKVPRKTPCTACLGLLDYNEGASDINLDKIAAAVKEADIQAKSYTINLSLPISVQFRAYFIWCRLAEKFPTVYELFTTLKPEGVCLKNAWKWICTSRLRQRVDPDSDWVTEGCLMVNVAFNYEKDEAECAHLRTQIAKTERSSKKGKGDISRTNMENFLKHVGIFEFKRKFGDEPPIASHNLEMESINCSHVNIFIAGRYNKYSRNVSQSPWIIDGKRVHDGSVEEFISDQVLPLTQAKQEKFSASGREDVDVRMLGRGRPFLMELVQPKRTLFTKQDISNLQDRINKSTNLIRVRDLQFVDKKEAGNLKEGEESKTKNYCALCLIPDTEITQEIIDKLNQIPTPIILQQKTPIRVLHRRSLMTRERSIYRIKAVAGKSKHLFKLYVNTQAGTYVKEFVHGDLGRTTPSVQEILGCDADIVSLDVESVEFAWPPQIND